MQVRERYSLKDHNTLALEQSTRYFAELSCREDVVSALDFAKQKDIPWMVIGCGSNLVLSRDYPGLVLHNSIPGIEKLSEDEGRIKLRIGAGENWHDLVEHTLNKGWYGLENLALIPGTAGAAPVQNIGAYGVELCEVLDSLEAWDQQQQSFITLQRSACNFSYRDSLFKQQAGRFIIVAITLDLSKIPAVNIRYDSLRQYFAGREMSSLTPREVFSAVVDIRRSKLPDPVRLPNAGSFFKNPVVSAVQHQRLREQFPRLVSYPAGEGYYKLAAGWLIDNAGWKGRCADNFCVHEAQALVLVHRGGGNGKQLLAFARQIQLDIRARYGVDLDIEPVIA